eukprot:12053-Heterococcus_DN1.PRE.1
MLASTCQWRQALFKAHTSCEDFDRYIETVLGFSQAAAVCAAMRSAKAAHGARSRQSGKLPMTELQIDNKPYIAPQSRKRPQSAGQRAHTNHSAQWDDSCALVQDSSPVFRHQQHHTSRGISNAAATESNRLQQRPQSASVNGRADSAAAHKSRPQSAAPHRSDHHQKFSSSEDTDSEHVAYQQHFKEPLPKESAALLASMERTAQTALTRDEQERLQRGYDLSTEESSKYKQFIDFLSSRDPMLQIHILEDAFRDAQIASGLHDYTGPSS